MLTEVNTVPNIQPHPYSFLKANFEFGDFWMTIASIFLFTCNITIYYFRFYMFHHYK